jgi:DNA-binding response OmpR family regulator
MVAGIDNTGHAGAQIRTQTREAFDQRWSQTGCNALCHRAFLTPLGLNLETFSWIFTRPREELQQILSQPELPHIWLFSKTGGQRMSQLKKILLVDDDVDLREALGEQLVMTEDFDVFEAESGADAIVKVKEAIFDLVILDVGLPDTDGRELCRRMRKQNVKCPILMLTGHDTDADTILGLDAGANDYVSKPFRFPVLLARIRAQLRQHEQSEDAVFQLGPYTFKPAVKMLVTEDDRKIRLTEKETNILKFLYRAADGVVARDVLLHEVWGYNAGVTTHTLETHIYRLRQKIEPDPSNARLLVTDSGGYRLVA